MWDSRRQESVRRRQTERATVTRRTRGSIRSGNELQGFGSRQQTQRSPRTDFSNSHLTLESTPDCTLTMRAKEVMSAGETRLPARWG